MFYSVQLPVRIFRDEDDMNLLLSSSQSNSLLCTSFLSLHRIYKSIFGVKCCPNYLVKKESEFVPVFFPFSFNFYSLMADYVIIIIIIMTDNIC